MTILSKKKNIQQKQEGESSESSNHIQNSHPHSLPIPLDNQCDDDDLYSPRDNLASGPSHGKRRHTSSPFRTSSRSLKHRGSPNHNNSSSNLAIAGPSTEPCGLNNGDDYNHSHNSQHAGGYNSGDEYDHSHNSQLTEAQWVEEDKLFEKMMRKKGLCVKKMGEDGACLFRAVADQIYGDQEMHGVVRKHCMDYVALNGDYFSHYVTEDFTTYVNRKRLDGTHGNHIEMQALSEMYNRTIEVFCYGKDPINIFHGNESSDNEPIRLSYHRGSHYNSIVDPEKATVGVGLGLPPESAEATQLNDAIRQSEDFHIEQAMLQDKLRATDWEATNEAIEQQVYRDSYLQYLRDNETRKKSMETPGSSTATEAGSPKEPVSDENMQNSQKENEFNKPFSLQEWDDAGILAQVLAESQQEYLDKLKKALTDCDDNMQEKPSTSS